MTSGMEADATRGVGANGATSGGQQLQGAATGLIDQATRTAEAQASTTMTRAGDTLQTFANAIRDASSGMREEQPDVAGLVGTAADRVEEAAMYLRDHGAREALDNAQRLARTQPALVVGGALVAGVVLGRLLRSGASAVQADQRSMPMHGARTTGFIGADADARMPGYGSPGYGARGYGSTGSAGYAGSAYGADAESSMSDELVATDLAADGSLGDADLASDTALSTDSVTGDGVRDEAPTAGQEPR
jgi:hypothetical protein